jgi:hypothetical protein
MILTLIHRRERNYFTLPVRSILGYLIAGSILHNLTSYLSLRNNAKISSPTLVNFIMKRPHFHYIHNPNILFNCQSTRDTKNPLSRSLKICIPQKEMHKGLMSHNSSVTLVPACSICFTNSSMSFSIVSTVCFVPCANQVVRVVHMSKLILCLSNALSHPALV